MPCDLEFDAEFEDKMVKTRIYNALEAGVACFFARFAGRRVERKLSVSAARRRRKRLCELRSLGSRLHSDLGGGILQGALRSGAQENRLRSSQCAHRGNVQVEDVLPCGSLRAFEGKSARQDMCREIFHALFEAGALPLPLTLEGEMCWVVDGGARSAAGGLSPVRSGHRGTGHD